MATMKARIFVDVDTQADFIAPAGKLFVSGAEKLFWKFSDLIEYATLPAPSIPTLLIGSMDTHDYRCPEFKENGGPFPRHCLKGTDGWSKASAHLPDNAVIIPEPLTRSGVMDLIPGCNGYYFEKSVYSIWDNDRVEAVLDAFFRQNRLVRAEDVDVYVFGVALDYCVRAAAEGFHEKGFNTHVIMDATVAVTEEGKRTTLASFKENGIKSITFKELGL